MTHARFVAVTSWLRSTGRGLFHVHIQGLGLELSKRSESSYKGGGDKVTLISIERRNLGAQFGLMDQEFKQRAAGDHTTIMKNDHFRQKEREPSEYFN